jgi:pimeloyl-ACP methyl ester carboxylesterase
MSLKNLALSLSLTLSFNAFALNTGYHFHQQSLQMQSNSSKFGSLRLRSDGTMRAQEVGYYNQKLDHKSASTETFKQRFFVDSQYAADEKSPVFYIICGEWNCAGTGSYSFVENVAKNMKAHLVALEHRFYGESMPTNNLRPEKLEHLTLQAAIDDLATFQKHMMDQRGFSGKWIAVGGSYAGTLAAFYREKHPELVVGALASSAPVLMKNAFSEYDAHIAKVINKSSCGDKVREAVKLIEDKMSTPNGSAEVKKIFKASELKNDEDFLYMVADMLAAAVQYGRDKVFCDALKSNNDLIAGYAQGGLSVLTAMGSTPFEISLAVAEREEVTAQDNMRQWLWQSCREFGWFQVANGTGSESSRSSRIDLPYHDEVCQRLYNVQMGQDGALNEEWYLPLFNPETSKIIFSNGSNDPWLTLSVVDGGTHNPGFDLFMMEGAAHCNDLRLVTNFPSVLAAHTKMEKIFADWLK